MILNIVLNPKTLWVLMLKLFGKSKDCSHPDADSDETLSVMFSQYFIEPLLTYQTLDSNVKHSTY